MPRAYTRTAPIVEIGPRGQVFLRWGKRRLIKCKRDGCLQTRKGKGLYCGDCSPMKDPEFRKARGLAAGRASKAAHDRRMMADVGHLTPQQAHAKGYRTGYRRAYRYWKAWAQRAVRRNSAA